MRRKRQIARPVLFFSLLLSTASFAQTGDARNYAQELRLRAEELRLADERTWHLLLHYGPSWFGGQKSEVDDPTFFFAPDGQTNPRAELRATISAFFAPAETDPEKQHAQCRFVARYSWLKERLGFDPERLPAQPCPMLDSWKASLAPKAVTLIFAAYYVNNPASMFGHTLLRLDREVEGEGADLLAYAVNYAASTGSDGGVPFAIKGLMGGYPGQFSLYPYYFKIQEYVNYESRDLWEYRLAFSQKQVDRIVEHLWELGHTYFDYYFVDENCSYHLLSLLEIADPSLHLRDQFRVFVAPSDTVKVVASVPGLVKATRYRPSLISQFRQHVSLLSGAEKNILARLLEEKKTLEKVSGDRSSPDRQALIADTALKFVSVQKKSPTWQQFRESLLSERSRNTSAPIQPGAPLSTPPELGHDSSRIGIAGGVTKHDSFEEIRFRGAYHDLMSPPEGYPKESEIESLKFRLRYYNEERKFWIEEATLINVTSLFSVDRFLRRLSWNVSFGFETERTDACDRCSAAFLRGGAGLATEVNAGLHQVYFVFVNAFTEISPWSSVETRFGPALQGGVLIDASKRWRMLAFGSVDGSPTGSPGIDYKARVENRITLTQDWELRLEASKFQRGEEALAALQVYF